MQSVLGFLAVIVGVVLAFKLIVILFHSLGWLIGVAAMVVWIGALIHIALNQFSSFGAKAFWFLLVLFTHVFGAVLYLLFGRPRNVISRIVY